ncbi:hypothetical protein [Planomonospora alba]
MVTPSLALWLAVVAADPDMPVRRADWRRNAENTARELTRRVGADMVTSPQWGGTWKGLIEALGVSRSTLNNLLRWFKEKGYVRVLATGSTIVTRRHLWLGRTRQIGDGFGNLAAEYVLTVPRAALAALRLPVEELAALAERPDEFADPVEGPRVVTQDEWREAPWPVETLPAPPVDRSCTPYGRLYVLKKYLLPTRTREKSGRPAQISQKPENPDTPPVRSHPAPESIWPNTATPETRKQRLLACRRLRAENMTLRGLSERHLRSLLRVPFSLGATLADVKYMIDHRPDGTPWLYDDKPHHLAGWLRYRLAPWIGEDGTLRAPLPSRAAAEAHRRHLARQAARRQEAARLRAERADPDPDLVAETRARLAAVRRSCAERREAEAAEAIYRIPRTRPRLSPKEDPLPQDEVSRHRASIARAVAKAADLAARKRAEAAARVRQAYQRTNLANGVAPA